MDATRQRILPGTAHTRADRKAAYRAMHFAAELLLCAGSGAVLDAPYGHAEDRGELAGVAAAGRSPWRLIECRVSPENAVRRLRERGYDPMRPDLTEARVESLARKHPYTGEGLVLDTDALPLEECHARIRAYLFAG